MRLGKKKLWIGFAFMLINTLLCIGATEVAARIWENNLAQGRDGWELVATRRIQIGTNEDSQYTFLYPNKDYIWEGVPVHINSQGMRDIEQSLNKPENEYRILVLGDSVTFGWEVSLEDTYDKQLESMLNEQGGPITYDVINAGVPGWDLPIVRAYLETHGLAYQPDLIIVGNTVLNDVQDCHDPIVESPPSLSLWLRDNTALWGFLTVIKSSIAGQLRSSETTQETNESSTPSYPFPLSDKDPDWEECVTTPVEAMSELAKQNNAAFMVVVFPMQGQVQSEDYPTTPQQVIKAFGRTHNIEVLDLLPIFRARYLENPTRSEEDSDNPLFADHYSHPSPLGHRLAAEATIQVMKDILKVN